MAVSRGDAIAITVDRDRILLMKELGELWERFSELGVEDIAVVLCTASTEGVSAGDSAEHWAK